MSNNPAITTQQGPPGPPGPAGPAPVGTGFVTVSAGVATATPAGDGLQIGTTASVVAADSSVTVGPSGLSVATQLAATLASANAYAQSLTYAVSSKEPAHLATTTALPSYTVSGAAKILTATANGAFPTQDGDTLLVTERLLVKDEPGVLRPNNGIYVLTDAGSATTPWILTRTSDADTAAELCGASVPVETGSTLTGTVWLFSYNQNTFILGTTNVIWQQITVPAATTSIAGIVQLAGDIGGSYTNVTVTGIQGKPALATSPASGDLMQYDGSQWAHTQVLGVANGGTNSTATPTLGGVAYGDGSAYQFTLAGTAGQILTSTGAGAPTWSAAPATGVTTFDGGTTGLTPASPTSGAVSLGGTLAIANGGTGSSTQNFVDLTTNQSVGGTKSFTDSVFNLGATSINFTGTSGSTVTAGFSGVSTTTGATLAVAGQTGASGSTGSVGGSITVTSGTGGDSSSGAGAVGGAITIVTGVGGAGTTPATQGKSGTLTLTTGTSLFGNTGDIVVDVGPAGLTGGTVWIGQRPAFDGKAGAVRIGNINATTYVYGTVQFPSTPLGAPSGGTGYSSYSTGDLLYGSTLGNSLTKLPIGTNGKVLTVVSGVPAWATPAAGTVTSVAMSTGTTGLTVSGGTSQTITSSGTFTIAGTLATANGGTNGTATPTAGAVAYGTGTAYAFTSAGTAGQVLTSNGAGAPTWAAAAGGAPTFTSVSASGALTLVGVDVVLASTSSAITLTLPTAVGKSGYTVTIKRSGAFTATLATTSSQTIDGLSGFALTVDNQAITLTSNGSNWIILSQYIPPSAISTAYSISTGNYSM